MLISSLSLFDSLISLFNYISLLVIEIYQIIKEDNKKGIASDTLQQITV